jgi:hypothetical protein
MTPLNLPHFEYKVKKAGGKVWIFDIIRKKFIQLTPEEWVRQHIINYFITELKYPRTLMKIERGVIFNSLNKRSDIVILDRKGNPWMVVECKSPDQKISALTLHQASIYNSTYRAPYLAVSNGINHLCFELDWNSRQINQIKTFPDYTV